MPQHTAPVFPTYRVPFLAHRPEPTDPPNPGEPDTVPDPTREPVEPVGPPIGDPPPQPNQAPHTWACHGWRATRTS